MIDKYLYFKLCWNEATNHLSMPITIFDRALVLGVFLKVFGITNYWAIIGVGFLGILGMLFVGHLAVRFGITAKQQSLLNKYNPEIQEILNK